MLDRLIKVLQFFRLADENGQLSLTTIAFAIGCYLLLMGKPVQLPTLSAFSIALASYHAKRYRQHAVAMRALDTVHEAGIEKLNAEKEVALQKRQDNADALSEKIEAVEKKVQELATPERLDVLRQMVKRTP